MGLAEAVKSDKALARAMNTYDGKVTYEAVAKDMGYDYVPIMDALGAKGR
jgi:alanine dehydrogenase